MRLRTRRVAGGHDGFLTQPWKLADFGPRRGRPTGEGTERNVRCVIVSFHGGAEGVDHRHVRPGTEMYLGAVGDPMLFARTAIDAGADLVLGHGPHVPRAVDLYKERFIIYSLGNFATYGRFSLRDQKGLAPILSVELNRDGTFERATIHSAIQRGEGGPVLDSDQRAFKDIRQLSQTDCPQSGLVFQGDGFILPTRN